MQRYGNERKDPVVYAAQRRELALHVRDEMAVRAARVCTELSVFDGLAFGGAGRAEQV